MNAATEQESIRRIVRQNATLVVENSDRVIKEFDRLHADKRDNEMTIATQNTLISMHESEKSTWESERRDLKGKNARDSARMSQDGEALDFTITYAICNCWLDCSVCCYRLCGVGGVSDA